MELRHLRYFIAVAETGSLTVAARDRLHTTQPSLSRQMADLEVEVGAKLFTRNVRGIELTAAGRVFLDHARVVLSQVEIGIESARRLAEPEKPHFVLGFLTGHESTWLPEALRLLHDELPNIHIVVTSQVSPHLAQGLVRGNVDAAFLRREDSTSDGVAFRLLAKEPLEVFMPSDHRLARLKSISPHQIVGETFLSVSGKALNIGRQPALRMAIDAYLKSCGLDIKPSHEVDNLAGIMSLITSTRGVALLPTYARNLIFGPVTSRPLKGTTPTIDLCLGYKKDNSSPVLQVFLSRLDELISRVSKKS
jgi:LysR family transcriptional regulator, hca operon transcriptional activator